MQREVHGRKNPGRQSPARGVPREHPTASPKNSVLSLQRSVGNRAVSMLLGGRPVVQRADLYVYGGGHVTDVNGPGTNERKPVTIVQQRLIDLGLLSKADAAADRARMDAQTGRIMASDISHTTAAIAGCDTPSLSEPAAKKVLKADLVAGVGTGETNDAADVDLVLNLLHEERHVTNADFDAGTIVIEGIGRTVDPAVVPGFLTGLTKLKKGYAGGYPFRGSTKRRKKLLVTAGHGGVPESGRLQQCRSGGDAEVAQPGGRLRPETCCCATPQSGACRGRSRCTARRRPTTRLLGSRPKARRDASTPSSATRSVL